MYRPEIKVLDCTIRDGGLINNHNFDHKFVKEVYRAISASGVDYIELGYKNSKELFSSDEYGYWKFCEDDEIKKIKEGVESDTKVAVMVDVGRVNLDDVKPASIIISRANSFSQLAVMVSTPNSATRSQSSRSLSRSARSKYTSKSPEL